MLDVRNPAAGHPIHLALTLDEARWLRTLVRNQSRTDELPEETEMRKKLFDFLSAYFTTP